MIATRKEIMARLERLTPVEVSKHVDGIFVPETFEHYAWSDIEADLQGFFNYIAPGEWS